MKRLIVGSCKATLSLLTVFPMAVLTEIAVETATGDSLFVDEFAYSSKRRLLKTLVFDWMTSGFWTILLALIAFLIVKFCGRKLGSKIILSMAFFLICIPIITPVFPLLLSLTLVYSLGISIFIHRWFV